MKRTKITNLPQNFIYYTKRKLASKYRIKSFYKNQLKQF